MPSFLTLPTSLSRLQAAKRWILAVTTGMGTSSPAEVLQNLIRILEGASPGLKLAIALATPWAMLGAALASYGRVWKALHTITNHVASSIYASVKIPGTHALQKQVLAFVVEQGLGKNARALTLSSAQRDAKQLMMDYMHPYDRIYGTHARHQKQQRHAEPEDSEKPPLSYVPQVGNYTFWWRGHRITLRQESREYEEKDSRGKYHFVMANVADIELSCLSLFGGAGPLRDFLKFVQNIPTTERTTTIYRPQSNAWDVGVVQSARNLNSVTMNSDIKDTLVRDVETYLQPATKKYYNNRGISWRRGFLFYGPPGTGKTSFANAIAGHFGLNVYMISLSTKTLSDDMLESLFEQLPNKCIVLLEDIDSAGIKRENMRQPKRRVKRARVRAATEYDEYGAPIPLPPTGITLSGLLNVLDGIHSREGMITIMTSNTPDSLDPALVRPGRIDRKVLFSFASKEVSAKLFRHIFEKTEEERIEGEVLSHGFDVAALAEQFADIVPADKLTPGDVQGFLLVHRSDPKAAVAEAKEWADRTLEIKAKGANVATFEGAPTTKPSKSSTAERGDGPGQHDSAYEDEDEDDHETASDSTTSGTQDPHTQPYGMPFPTAMTLSHPNTPAYNHTYRHAWTGTYPARASSQPMPDLSAMAGGAALRDMSRMMSQFQTAPQTGASKQQPTPPYSRSGSRSPPTSTEAGSSPEKGSVSATGGERKGEQEGQGDDKGKKS